MSQIKDLRPPKMTKVEKIHKLSGGAPISGLPEIGTSSTQVGYSRLAVRRLEGWPRAQSRLWPSFETRALQSSLRRLRKLVCACAPLRTRLRAYDSNALGRRRVAVAAHHKEVHGKLSTELLRA